MGSRQAEFLAEFREAFSQRVGVTCSWTGGQVLGNVAHLPRDAALRKEGLIRAGERFELGDLRTEFLGTMLVVEYDSGGISLSNLLKYWPYLREELSVPPKLPLVLWHFSDWGSWGAYRDLWQWQVARMHNDPVLRVPFTARQFDHGGKNAARCTEAVQEAIDWLLQTCPEAPP